jgi:hypothetical protein
LGAAQDKGRATTACGKVCRRQADDGAPSLNVLHEGGCTSDAALLTLLAGWHASELAAWHFTALTGHHGP